jgi:hypothetical protein
LALETRASDLWNERDKRPLKDLMECRYVLVHDLGDVFYFDNSEKQDGQRKPGKFGLYFRPYVGRPENNFICWANSLFKEKRWHPFDRLFEACDKDKDEMKKQKLLGLSFNYRNMLTNIAPCKQKKNSKPGAV